MGNTKFKIGDTVKVTGVTGNRREYNGRIFDIRSINPNGNVTMGEHYGVEPLGDKPRCPYIFYSYELVLVKAAPFNKANLEDGMVVEYRTGERALVVADRFLRFDSNMKFCDYKDDLTLIHPCTFVGDKPSYDITKVYTIETGSPLDLHDIFRDHHIKLIWERKEEAKEMTVAEIEEKLGYKVKIVDGE